MQNGEGDNNQCLIVSTSIASTAGSTSINITTETIGDGGILMPGALREYGRHDNHNRRSDQPVASFGATNDIECTKSFTWHFFTTNYTTDPAENISAADSSNRCPLRFRILKG